MTILPRTRAAWGNVFLLAFKVYVLIGWLGAGIYLDNSGHYWEPSDLERFNAGYVLCCVVLFFGGLMQCACRQRSKGIVSIAVAGLASFILWLLPSGLAKA
jgi:hypothetical protein